MVRAGKKLLPSSSRALWFRSERTRRSTFRSSPRRGKTGKKAMCPWKGVGGLEFLYRPCQLWRRSLASAEDRHQGRRGRLFNRLSPPLNDRGRRLLQPKRLPAFRTQPLHFQLSHQHYPTILYLHLNHHIPIPRAHNLASPSLQPLKERFSVLL
jgi:hypothetical protein